MALWVVRAGRDGEHEALALEKGLSVIGWQDVGDLSGVESREELRGLCEKAYPDAPSARISNYVGQLWAFRERIKEGDLVVLPLKTRSVVAIGRVKGPYRYRPDLPEDARHSRPVEWVRTDDPRAAFASDLLQSFGAAMTVCQVLRHDAEERLRGMLTGKKPLTPPVEPSPEESLDLEEYAREQIREYIGRKFRGHDLARLVNDLLKAQGYRTQFSPPGPDKGADIIAGAGPMGFDPPLLCVQVKSSDSPVEVGVLRELRGTMKTYTAQHGLLVSWGGFKSSVISEARPLFFEVRLWDAGDLVSALLEHYDQLPPETQAELPLKRMWSLVLGE